MRSPREPVDLFLPADVARCLRDNAEDNWHARRFTNIPEHGVYTLHTNLYVALCLATELRYLAEDVEDGKISTPHPPAAEIYTTLRAVLAITEE